MLSSLFNRRTWGTALVLIPYLATGLYVVGGNEKAVVRRFGRVQTTAAGTVLLQNSGLHYDLPWPWSQVDRVNFNEVRTLSIGSAEDEVLDSGPFLQSVEPARESQFLTGDKNILHVQFNVHYRIAEPRVEQFLYANESPEAQLRLLAESALADAVIRSGVDFVHTLGRNELRELMISRMQALVEAHALGIDVEDITVGGVYPPIRVKAQFLEVMNARADRETYIHQANAYAEQQLADARASAQKKLDEAQTYRQRGVEEAKGAADSFVKLVERFHYDEQQGIQSYAAARQMAMRRRYLDTIEEVYRKVAGKVLLDSGKPVDLTIFRDPQE